MTNLTRRLLRAAAPILHHAEFPLSGLYAPPGEPRVLWRISQADKYGTVTLKRFYREDRTLENVPVEDLVLTPETEEFLEAIAERQEQQEQRQTSRSRIQHEAAVANWLGAHYTPRAARRQKYLEETR